MEFKDKFIGYIDILGFRKMVEAAEARTGMSLADLLELQKELGLPEERKKFEKNGPTTCPQSKYIQRDLDFRLTQISDGVLISSEVTPAGVINLVSYCHSVIIRLLYKGIMCRGYITRGTIYHTDEKFIGSGFHNAYDKESKGVEAFKREADEKGTPFVEIDSIVCDYVQTHGDSCVKEMFSRFTRTDGKVTALFPFQRLSHSFIIAGFGHTFDPEKEKISNHNMRLMIARLRERVSEFVDRSNPKAVRKAEYYMAALDEQLESCDRTDEVIDVLLSPYPKPKDK